MPAQEIQKCPIIAYWIKKIIPGRISNVLGMATAILVIALGASIAITTLIDPRMSLIFLPIGVCMFASMYVKVDKNGKWS